MVLKDRIRVTSDDLLAIIDYQNDFAKKDGALYVKGVKGEPTMLQVFERLAQLLAMFYCAIVSRDNHPAEGHAEYKIFGRHCVKDSKGAQLCQELENLLVGHINAANQVFDLPKGENPYLFSYSVATSPKFPELIEQMRESGIKRVFLCGLAYTHCVGESAIAFATQGFETYVVRNATCSVPPPHGDPDAMDQKLALYGVKLVRAQQLFK